MLPGKMLEEKTPACAEGFHFAVAELYSHLCEISPITVNCYGERTRTLTPEALFVGAKLSEVENARQRYSTEPDRLFSALSRIDKEIVATLRLNAERPEQPSFAVLRGF